MELKPFMRPAGEQVSGADQRLAFHSLAAYIRRSFRGQPHAHIDPRNKENTLYLASTAEIGALTQAARRPDNSRRWVFLVDPARYAIFRYRSDPVAEEVRRIQWDVDFAMDVDDAIHAPDSADTVSFLGRALTGLQMDRQFETNFTPVGSEEITGLVTHLQSTSAISFEAAMLWTPPGYEA